MPELRGYLFKLSPAFLKGYQRRYFMILNEHLAYFECQEDIHPKGSIGVGEIVRVQAKAPLYFDIITHDKTYQLKCENNQERQYWLDGLNRIIHSQ
jgi:hypothetical protein